MGRGQVVRHRVLVPAFAGSNPADPATKSAVHSDCFFRGKSFGQFGAILLSPPNDQNQVDKLHLCTECYILIQKFIQDNPNTD